MEEEQEITRFTFNINAELQEKMRDTALILGIKAPDLLTRALTKYIEAIENSAGGEFKTAMEAIKKVRKLG